MASRNVEFTVEIADFDADAAKRLSEARNLVSTIEKEIASAFEKSDRFKAVRDLAGLGDMGHKNSSFCRVDGRRIVARTYVELAEEKTAKSTPYLSLGEKTVNTLLNGKLLTDEQKKALIKRLGFDLDDLSETAGA
ncbi:hypothetical protein EVC10_046 [Rhizobium phage RHph_Y25]|nr:hypothetical protein EVC10_046 [Rhizobium phage RHph_Y25]